MCAAWTVSIPVAVRRETVEQAPALPDATRIREHIAAGHLTVTAEGNTKVKGEDAVLELYWDGAFDAVATDDTRFI